MICLCDMHYVYGYCDGNASAAVNEYRRRYSERRIPSKRIFTRVEQALRDNGCLPDTGLAIVRKLVLNGFVEEKGLEWKNCVGVCTDGAACLTRINSGLVTKIKDIAGNNLLSTHCFIHR